MQIRLLLLSSGISTEIGEEVVYYEVTVIVSVAYNTMTSDKYYFVPLKYHLTGYSYLSPFLEKGIHNCKNLYTDKH